MNKPFSKEMIGPEMDMFDCVMAGVFPAGWLSLALELRKPQETLGTYTVVSVTEQNSIELVR